MNTISYMLQCIIFYTSSECHKLPDFSRDNDMETGTEYGWHGDISLLALDHVQAPTKGKDLLTNSSPGNASSDLLHYMCKFS